MEKIAILTTFQEFNPGYSLTGIVKDQCKMFTRYGHDVTIIVCEQFNDKYEVPEGVTIKRVMPFGHLIDYHSKKDLTEDHVELVKKTEQMMLENLSDIDIIIDHDLCFTGWNMPYAFGIMKASKKLNSQRWLHWIHSVPSSNNDWWDVKLYGPKHKFIFPNFTERTRVAEQFKGSHEEVRIIPHIKDLRTWANFSNETNSFIDEYPAVMQADIVCIYPASCDRLDAKGIAKVLSIFANFKGLGFTVFFAVANQWATGTQPKENLAKYNVLAKRLGLNVGEEFIFTSEFDKPKYELGLSKRMLRELMSCSNLFIFPTMEESFGLVAPEISLSTSALIVLNKSLLCMAEIHSNKGLYVDFGSFQNRFEPEDIDEYFLQVSKLILGKMFHDESLVHRTVMRKKFNMDTLYSEYYLPIFGEAKSWDYKKS